MDKVRASWFVCLGVVCVAATGARSAFVRQPSEERAWALLEKGAAWSDSMRSPRTPCWLEYRTQMPCGWPARGTRDCVVRIARAGDGRVAWDVWMEPGPAGVRMRYDGSRYVEHSLWGGSCIVADAPPESVRTSLAGEMGGSLASLALGLRVFAAVRYQRSRPARCVAVERLVVDGRAWRCERVRVGPDPRARTARSDDYWIDAETGCLWRHASIDSSGRPLPGEASGYLFLRMEVPPDSCFATMLPEGVRAVTGDLESTRPRPQISQALAPRILPDSTATFRWTGEARRVALVGSFNCWDPQADPMVRGADGVWTRSRSVEVSQFNDYLFLLDGTRYVMDPLNPSCRGDGFGGWISCILTPPQKN